MSNARTRPNLVRRALRVALCYVLALQAFAAAFGTALAIGVDRGAVPGFIICHNSGSDKSSAPASGTPQDAPCALCAVASSAVSLPDPISIVAVSATIAGSVRHADVPLMIGPRAARAGLARAPPQFV